MLTISLTLVVLISAIVLLHQYVTGALLSADDAPTRLDSPQDETDRAAPRAA